MPLLWLYWKLGDLMSTELFVFAFKEGSPLITSTSVYPAHQPVPDPKVCPAEDASQAFPLSSRPAGSTNPINFQTVFH